MVLFHHEAPYSWVVSRDCYRNTAVYMLGMAIGEHGNNPSPKRMLQEDLFYSKFLILSESRLPMKLYPNAVPVNAIFLACTVPKAPFYMQHTYMPIQTVRAYQ
jgi:hypothetical protein